MRVENGGRNQVDQQIEGAYLRWWFINLEGKRLTWRTCSNRMPVPVPRDSDSVDLGGSLGHF